MIVGCGDPHDPLRLARVERAGGEHAVGKIENRLELRCERERSPGRLKPVRTPQEQRVPEDLAQSGERMTHRRLRHRELRGRLGRLAGAEEARQHRQQGEIQFSDIDLLHIVLHYSSFVSKSRTTHVAGRERSNEAGHADRDHRQGKRRAGDPRGMVRRPPRRRAVRAPKAGTRPRSSMPCPPRTWSRSRHPGPRSRRRSPPREASGARP